jgi:hypothetical protein
MAVVVEYDTMVLPHPHPGYDWWRLWEGGRE